MRTRAKPAVESRANPDQDSESVAAAESLSDTLQLIPDQADAFECDTEPDSGQVAQTQAEPYVAESESPHRWLGIAGGR